MEVITFSDSLVHYKAKLKEAQEYLDEVSTLLASALECIEASWQGKSAEACTVKLEDLKPELEKAKTAITRADTAVRQIESITLSQII